MAIGIGDHHYTALLPRISNCMAIDIRQRQRHWLLRLCNLKPLNRAEHCDSFLPDYWPTNAMQCTCQHQPLAVLAADWPLDFAVGPFFSENVWHFPRFINYNIKSFSAGQIEIQRFADVHCGKDFSDLHKKPNQLLIGSLILLPASSFNLQEKSAIFPIAKCC